MKHASTGLRVRLAAIDHRGGNLWRLRHRLRREQDQAPSTPASRSTRSSALRVARGRRVADQIDRIAVRPVCGQQRGKRLQRRRAERGEAYVALGHAIRGHHSEAAGVGHDREPIALGAAAAREQSRGREQLVERGRAHCAGTAQRTREHRVVSGQRARVRGGGAAGFGAPARLEHDHGFHARRGAQAAHEPPRVIDALDVQQDGIGFRVEGQIIEHLAEADVGGGTERQQAPRTRARARRPNPGSPCTARPTATRAQAARRALGVRPKKACTCWLGRTMPTLFGPSMRMW